MSMGPWPLASHFRLPPKAILYLAHWSLDLNLRPLNPGWMQFPRPLPDTAKWASGAWCAIIAKVLGLGLASFWARLGNCLGHSLVYFWCSLLFFCLGACFGSCFGLAFGTSSCFGQCVESILLILGQIIGLWCLHLPWQWLTRTWDEMPYMANNYDALSPQSSIQ